ncbi:MAG TPA: MFS transporter [Sporichthyaceae bacterium]|jgi:MFS family permease|nr:MFS transporter [Sporichthyaceae bacterium]
MTTLHKLGTRCLLIALTMYLVMTGATVPTALYGLWAARYGFGTLMVTVIFSVYVVGVVIGLLGLGGLSDAIGRRPVLLAAIAASAVSDAAYLHANTLSAIFVARLISGLATGLVAGTATAAMVDIAPSQLRGAASTTALVANAGGLASGPVLGGAFAQYLSSPTRLVYVAHLTLLVVATIGTLIALPRGTRRPEVSLRPRGLAVPAQVRTAFWRSSTAGGSGFAVAGLLNAAIGLFLVQLAHVHDLLLAGVIAGLTFGTVGLGQILGRWLAAQAGLFVACGGLLLSCLLNAVSLALGSVDLLVLAGMTAGTSTGLAIGHGIATINTQCPPERRGETNSAFFAVMYIGLSVPVIGAGVAVDAMGLQSGGELFSGAVAVIVAGVGLSLLTDMSRHPEATDPGATHPKATHPAAPPPGPAIPHVPAPAVASVAPAPPAAAEQPPAHPRHPARAVLHL